MLAEKFGKYSEYAPLVVRLVLGLVLIWHGIGFAGFDGATGIPLMEGKLFNIPGVADMFGSFFGLPVPIVFAVIAAVVEGIGGVLLLLGVATRLVGGLVAIQFAIATVMHILKPAFDIGDIGRFELTLLIFAAGVVLLLLGGGPYSLEKTVFKKELI